MQKSKKPAHSSFVRLALVPCLILAQPVLLQAKSKKQEGGRSPAVVKNPMDPILGCMSANEVATRRLSNPKWAVRGAETAFGEFGMLIQTTKFQSQTGATYEKDFAWIPTTEGASKIDVTGVPRNTVAYVKQPLPIVLKLSSSGSMGFGFPIGGGPVTSDQNSVPLPEKNIEYIETVYSPGIDPGAPVSKLHASNRIANAYQPPEEDYYPKVMDKWFAQGRKFKGRIINRVLTAESKKNDPATRKVFLDEMKKRFEEYSNQSERDRLAAFSEDPKFGRIVEHWEQQEKYLEGEGEVLDQLNFGLLTPQMKKENEARADELGKQLNKLHEEQEKYGAEAMKATTFKDFLRGLRGCKAALEKDHWNEDEEFQPFYRSVVAELDRLKALQLRARTGQTPSGQKSGTGSAAGAGQAQ